MVTAVVASTFAAAFADQSSIAAPADTTTSHPDAGLIELGRCFDSACADADLALRDAIDDDALDGPLDRVDALADAIVKMDAKTAAGLAVKARAFLREQYVHTGGHSERLDYYDKMAKNLAESVLGLSCEATTIPTAP